MHVFVRDDLVEIGLTEDGEAEIARQFYLVAEAPNGARWGHDYSRLNKVRTMFVDEYDGPVHGWARDDEAAEKAMEALRAKVAGHIAKGGKLDPQHWNEIDPAYGSAAYQRLDAVGYFWGQEVLRAVDAGEPISAQAEAEARMYVEWAA